MVKLPQTVNVLPVVFRKSVPPLLVVTLVIVWSLLNVTVFPEIITSSPAAGRVPAAAPPADKDHVVAVAQLPLAME